jgi:hypothetical protein
LNKTKNGNEAEATKLASDQRKCELNKTKNGNEAEATKLTSDQRKCELYRVKDGNEADATRLASDRQKCELNKTKNGQAWCLSPIKVRCGSCSSSSSSGIPIWKFGARSMLEEQLMIDAALIDQDTA